MAILLPNEEECDMIGMDECDHDKISKSGYSTDDEGIGTDDEGFETDENEYPEDAMADQQYVEPPHESRASRRYSSRASRYSSRPSRRFSSRASRRSTSRHSNRYSRRYGSMASRRYTTRPSRYSRAGRSFANPENRASFRDRWLSIYFHDPNQDDDVVTSTHTEYNTISGRQSMAPTGRYSRQQRSTIGSTGRPSVAPDDMRGPTDNSSDFPDDSRRLSGESVTRRSTPGGIPEDPRRSMAAANMRRPSEGGLDDPTRSSRVEEDYGRSDASGVAPDDAMMDNPRDSESSRAPESTSRARDKKWRRSPCSVIPSRFRRISKDSHFWMDTTGKGACGAPLRRIMEAPSPGDNLRSQPNEEKNFSPAPSASPSSPSQAADNGVVKRTTYEIRKTTKSPK